MNPATTTIKKWLREQLIPLVNVQRVSLSQASMAGDPVRDIDLTVFTWAGVIIQVHLIDEPLKAAKVRRILENASGAGIATLFILDAGLLPRPGERIDGDKWYLVFQQLGNDRLYSYRLGKNGVEIRAAQFVSVTRNESELQYGPIIPIQQLRYLRQTIKHASVKGYWLMADFETERSARNPAFRSPPTTETARPSSDSHKNGSSPQLNQPPQPKTRLDLSYELLGVARSATREEVKAAFRKKAFAVHPDVSDLPKEEAEARFKVISEAYEYIRVTNSW
ncbi:MAG: J domain-containing protein [Chloroflexota bacterium]